MCINFWPFNVFNYHPLLYLITSRDLSIFTFRPSMSLDAGLGNFWLRSFGIRRFVLGSLVLGVLDIRARALGTWAINCTSNTSKIRKMLTYQGFLYGIDYEDFQQLKNYILKIILDYYPVKTKNTLDCTKSNAL